MKPLLFLLVSPLIPQISLCFAFEADWKHVNGLAFMQSKLDERC